MQRLFYSISAKYYMIMISPKTSNTKHYPSPTHKINTKPKSQLQPKPTPTPKY